MIFIMLVANHNLVYIQ